MCPPVNPKTRARNNGTRPDWHQREERTNLGAGEVDALALAQLGRVGHAHANAVGRRREHRAHDQAVVDLK